MSYRFDEPVLPEAKDITAITPKPGPGWVPCRLPGEYDSWKRCGCCVHVSPWVGTTTTYCSKHRARVY